MIMDNNTIGKIMNGKHTDMQRCWPQRSELPARALGVAVLGMKP